MKFTKIALFAALAIVTALSSCKKKDEDTVTFDNSKDVIVEMSWSVTETNGTNSYTYTAGNSYVDVDMYIDDADFNTGIDFTSSSGGSFESEVLATSTPSKKYYIGYRYYGNNVTPTSGYHYVVNYTIKAYQTGNPGGAKYYSGSFSTATTSSSQIGHFTVSLDKTSSGFLFNSISEVVHTY